MSHEQQGETMTETIIDEATYYAMCEPFATEKEANAAINGFWADLRELRKKWRLPDIHVVVRVVMPDGTAFMSMHCGSDMFEEPMAAWAMGRAQAARAAKIRAILKGDE